jgi:hypothetical protein
MTDKLKSRVCKSTYTGTCIFLFTFVTSSELASFNLVINKFRKFLLNLVYELISIHNKRRVGKDYKSVFHFQIFDLLAKISTNLIYDSSIRGDFGVKMDLKMHPDLPNLSPPYFRVSQAKIGGSV